MLAVNGYYNGNSIVLDKEIEMKKGQRLIVVLETSTSGRERRKLDLNQYVTPTERGKNVEAYMEEMRGNDRI